MFVDPAHRKKGVAEKLFSAIIKDLKGEIRLNVAKYNAPAINLYRKFGFAIEKEFTGDFNGYESQAMTMILTK